MVLKHPQWHGGSEYVLSFEIGQQEGGGGHPLLENTTINSNFITNSIIL